MRTSSLGFLHDKNQLYEVGIPHKLYYIVKSKGVKGSKAITHISITSIFKLKFPPSKHTDCRVVRQEKPQTYLEDASAKLSYQKISTTI